MFKLFKLRLNKPQKPNIKYKDPANKRAKVVRTRKTKKFELKRVDYKYNKDAYYLLKKGEHTIALSKEARGQLKRYPEIVKVVENLLFDSKTPVIENSKYKMHLSRLNPDSNSGRNNIGTYKLSYFDKTTNKHREYFLKLGEKYDIGNYPSINEFESQKILEAEGFNIIRPQFAIWGPGNKKLNSPFYNIIVYDFTNLLNYETALRNRLLTRQEIKHINRNLSKARWFAENKLDVTDISTRGNVFLERLPSGEIKLYFTDSAKIWKGRD